MDPMRERSHRFIARSEPVRRLSSTCDRAGPGADREAATYAIPVVYRALSTHRVD